MEINHHYSNSDKSLLAIGDSSGSVVLERYGRDGTSKNLLNLWQLHGNFVTLGLTFDPVIDKPRLLSTSDDGIVRCIDLKRGEEAIVFYNANDRTDDKGKLENKLNCLDNNLVYKQVLIVRHWQCLQLLALSAREAEKF